MSLQIKASALFPLGGQDWPRKLLTAVPPDSCWNWFLWVWRTWRPRKRLRNRPAGRHCESASHRLCGSSLRGGPAPGNGGSSGMGEMARLFSAGLVVFSICLAYGIIPLLLLLIGLGLLVKGGIILFLGMVLMVLGGPCRDVHVVFRAYRACAGTWRGSDLRRRFIRRCCGAVSMKYSPNTCRPMC